MTTSIILGIALVLLIIIVIIREIEIRKRKTLSITVFVSGLDPFCARTIKTVLGWGFGASSFFQRFVSVHTIPLVSRIGRHIHFRAHSTVKETHKMLKGRRKLSNGGSVNFFFHSVGEHKKLASKNFDIKDVD